MINRLLYCHQAGFWRNPCCSVNFVAKTTFLQIFGHLPEPFSDGLQKHGIENRINFLYCRDLRFV